MIATNIFATFFCELAKLGVLRGLEELAEGQRVIFKVYAPFRNLHHQNEGREVSFNESKWIASVSCAVSGLCRSGLCPCLVRKIGGP